METKGIMLALLLTSILTLTFHTQPVLANQYTITFQPGPSEGKDSYIWSTYPGNNYGWANYMIVGVGDQNLKNSLIEFDLSVFPSNAIILSATLGVWQYSWAGEGDVDVSAHRILTYWSEDGATWLMSDIFNSWTSAGGDYHSDPEDTQLLGSSTTGYWIPFDVTSLVQGWVSGSYPNYGILLKGSGELLVGIAFVSSNLPPSSLLHWPYLEITYTLPTAITVSTDVKPGSDPNSINLGDQGLLPVAILGEADFDVSNINASTIELGGVDMTTRGSAKAPKLAYSFEDVNEDGYTDLMAFFSIADLVFEGVLTETTTALTITATLYDGTSTEGTDSVRVVPP